MNIFSSIYYHVKYYRILKKIYKDEDTLKKMSEFLQSNVRMDYIGRLYTVLNPSLIKKEDKVYELLDGRLDDREFVERWIMERLSIMEKFIQAENLFDLLTYKIEKLNDNNDFLLIIEPITTKDFIKSLKISTGLIILLIAMIITISLI